MHGKALRLKPALALAAAALTLVVSPSVALGAPTIANLRVEAGGQALSRGISYVNNTARIGSRSSECGGSGKTFQINGPTAMGLVRFGSETNRALRPYFISDKFDFGLIVCRIGTFGAFDANKAWLYKVNHVAPEVGGDQLQLRRGDRVLWYFANFSTGRNTGAELTLSMPARVRPGHTFTVTAYAYDLSGKAKPAAGVHLTGDADAMTGPNGTAQLKARGGDGWFDLRGTRGNDVPTKPSGLCVNAQLEKCPPILGELIVGTGYGDWITGTSGADRIIARTGNDRIYVRRGGPDVVSCGGGHDTVWVGVADRISSDCEVRR